MDEKNHTFIKPLESLIIFFSSGTLLDSIQEYSILDILTLLQIMKIIRPQENYCLDYE
jgi:hypothetical protein